MIKQLIPKFCIYTFSGICWFIAILFCDIVPVNAQQTAGSGQELFQQAVALQDENHFSASSAIFEQCLPVFKEEENWLYYFKARIGIVYNTYDDNNYKHAKALAHQVIKDYQAWEMPKKHIVKLGDAYLALGSICESLNDFDESIRAHEHALEAYQTMDEQAEEFETKEKVISYCYNNLGKTYLDLHRLTTALGYLEKALAIKTKVLGTYHQSTHNTSRLIGRTYFEMGYLNKALEIYKEVLDSENEINDVDGKALCYREISKVYQRMQDYKTAEEYARRAITLYNELSFRQREKLAFSYHQLGNVLKDVGNYAASIPWFEKAIEKFDETLGTGSFNSALSTMNIGKAYTYLEDFEQGMSYYREAEKLFQKNVEADNARYNELWLSMGSNLLQNNDREGARKLFQKAYQLAKTKQSPRSYDRGLACQYLATAIDDIDEALLISQEGLWEYSNQFEYTSISENPDAEDIYDAIHALSVFETKIELLQKKYKETGNDNDLKISMNAVQAASDLIDLTRQSFLTESAKKRVAIKARSVYEKGTLLAFQLYNLEASPQHLNTAFRMMEKSRSMILLETLHSESANTIIKIPDSIAFRKQYLHQSILDLETQFEMAEADTQKSEQLNNEIFKLKTEARALDLQIKADFPEVAELAANLEEPDIQDIQTKLAPGEIVLEYLITDDELFLLKISADKVEGYQKPYDASIKASVLKFIDLLKDNTLAATRGADPALFTEFSNMSFGIYEAILGFAMDGSGNKLIIIPDLYFNYLPFEILLTNDDFKGHQLKYKDLPYLLKNYSIRYSFSANLQFNHTPQTKNHNAQLLAFAPQYEGSTNQILATRSGFTALTQTKKEVETITAYTGGTAKTGLQANESNFKNMASDFGILHLAMHAYTDEEYPMMSGLVFTETDDKEDDVLHTYELHGMQLNAQLAVLSACNTGSGKLEKGEGVMSLARGFRRAGVPNIVMSLWQVDDESTRIIMEHFYHYLKAGKGKDEALQQAKLAFLASASRPYPHYWSPFVLMGDGIALEFVVPQSSNTPVILIIFSLFLALVCLWFFLKNKKEHSP